MVIATGNSEGGGQGRTGQSYRRHSGIPSGWSETPPPPPPPWRGIHFQMKCEFLKNSAFPGNSKGVGQGGTGQSYRPPRGIREFPSRVPPSPPPHSFSTMTFFY